MLIKRTKLSKARLMDFYQIMSIIADFLKKEDLTKLKLTLNVEEFLAVFNLLDKAMKQAIKTGYTDPVIAADDARDAVLTGFFLTLKGIMYFPDENIRIAATAITNITDKYGSNIARLPQREETAGITNMTDELTSSINAPHLEVTSLKKWIDKLIELNRAFDTLYTSRTEKEAEFIVGLTRTQRSNMQAAFDKLCLAIESYAFINDSADYKPLADKINAELANVQQATKARATMAKNAQASQIEDQNK